MRSVATRGRCCVRVECAEMQPKLPSDQPPTIGEKRRTKCCIRGPRCSQPPLTEQLQVDAPRDERMCSQLRGGGREGVCVRVRVGVP